MGQLSLEYVDTATGANINTPAPGHIKGFRDNAVSGSGTYYVKLSDGTLEELGGPGAGVGTSQDIWSIAPVNSHTAPGPQYIGFFTANFTTVEGETQFTYNGTIPVTLSRLSVRIISTTVNGTGTTLSVRVNNVNTALAVSIPAGSANGSLFQDNTDSVVVSPGDEVSIQASSAGNTGTLDIANITVIALP